MKNDAQAHLAPSMEAAAAAVANRCARDPAWMKAFKANPRGALEALIGQKIPAGMTLHIHQNDAANWHVPVGETADAELDALGGVIMSADG